jgi:hypothetical protein
VEDEANWRDQSSRAVATKLPLRRYDPLPKVLVLTGCLKRVVWHLISSFEKESFKEATLFKETTVNQ